MQKSVQQYAKKCRSCGRSFFAKKSDAKYCSRSCRAIYNRQLASDDDEATIIDFYTGALLDPTELNVMNKTVGFKAQRLEIEPICRNKKYRHGIGNLGVAANSEYDVLAFISEREARDYAIQNGLHYQFGNYLIIERNSLWIPCGWGSRYGHNL